MYTVILLALIGLLIGVVMSILEGWESEYIVICGVLMVIFSMGGFVIACCLPITRIVKSYNTRLICLQDLSGSEGSFFLGSGNINGEIKYSYYVQNNDSSYQLFQAPIGKSSIMFTDKQPTLTISQEVVEDNLYNKFAIEILDGNETFLFKIPRGSIKSVYDLDAK